MIIKISGIEYEVLEVTPEQLYAQPDYDTKEKKESLDRLLGPNGENFGGMCDGQACKIFINSEISNRSKRIKVLAHEIMEAIEHENLLGLKHNQVEQIANALLTSNIIALDKFIRPNAPKKKSK